MNRVAVWSVWAVLGVVLVALAAYFSDYLRTQVLLPGATAIDVTGDIDTSKLEAGNHTFEVRARSSSGEELSKVVPFSVVSSPTPAPTPVETTLEETPTPTPTPAPTPTSAAAETPPPAGGETPIPETLPLSSPLESP